MIKCVRVPNMIFSVKKVDYSHIDDGMRVTDREKQKISIQTGLTINMEKITLLHEILHSLELNSGIKYCEECQIEQFAHGLFFVLRNNLELIEYLLGDMK